MGNAPDLATSLTLIEMLCAPEKDEAKWGIFCKNYEPLIRHWCERQGLQKVDVDDVTQIVLLRVFTKLATYDAGRGNFRGWLKTVVENAVRDFVRGRGRRPGDVGSGDSDVLKIIQNIEQPENTASLVDELSTSMQRDLNAIVAQVEQQVTAETMCAFRLTVLEGRSIADAAVELGKPYMAVYMAAKRVKDKLRAAAAQLGTHSPNTPEKQS
jgi:RNA polymerase sigma factor (sigma-70 family)